MTIGYFATTTETDYSYTTTASTTVNPTLKDRNGNNFPAGKVALVYMFIEGTGTPDTDQLYAVGYAGSGAGNSSTSINYSVGWCCHGKHKSATSRKYGWYCKQQGILT